MRSVTGCASVPRSCGWTRANRPLVAEKEVLLLEHYPEVRNLKTRLLDEEGKPAEFSSFKVGDAVLVLGYCEPNGHV